MWQGCTFNKQMVRNVEPAFFLLRSHVYLTDFKSVSLESTFPLGAI